MPRTGKINNIHLVAERAGVSVASVSRVVNNRTDVSEKTRRRVQAVIDELNFSPNKGSDRLFHIGIILSPEQPVVSNYMSPLIAGMTDFASRSNLILSVMVNAFGARGRALIQLIRERRCDALCIPMDGERHAEIDVIDRSGIPAMLINTATTRRRRIGYINNHSYAAACKVTEHLLKLGHRKIAFSSQAVKNDENHTARIKGYLDTLRQYGVTPKKQWFVEHIPTMLAQEAGYLQAMRLFRQAPETTAVIAADDEIAMGTYKACWETGRRIPEDLSVTGFDDLPQSKYLTPPLTTARNPLFEIGSKAINYLQLYLQNTLEELPCETLEPELIVRQSSGAPRNDSLCLKNKTADGTF